MKQTLLSSHSRTRSTEICVICPESPRKQVARACAGSHFPRPPPPTWVDLLPHLPSQAEAGAGPAPQEVGGATGQRRTLSPTRSDPTPQGSLGGLLRTGVCDCSQGPIKARANPFNEQHLAAPVLSKAGWSLGGNQRGQAVGAAPLVAEVPGLP